jgi:butyryl-CoA dehydrogenase
MVLTDDQLEMKRMFREFFSEQIAPHAAEYDESEEFPRANIRKLAELGYMGMPIPEEYGGAGMDLITYLIAVEELARACPSTAFAVAAHTSLCAETILKFGKDPVKQKFLPDLASGRKLGALGLTEVTAGSDAAATKTKATSDGDYYVINGSKQFITNGSEADVVLIAAKTVDVEGPMGISAIVIERGTEGFTHGAKEKKLGIRASATAPLYFENCRVPKENLVGREGRGYLQFMDTFDSGRVGIGAMAVGIAQAALDASLTYAKQREQFGKPIAGFQMVQAMIAEMATQLEAARQLTYHAAQMKLAGRKFRKEASMAKWFASTMAVRVTDLAIQIHGGYGYTRDFPVERLHRDAKILDIVEGTSEVQKMVIALEALRHAGASV